jgi:predicted dehydrogenase
MGVSRYCLNAVGTVFPDVSQGWCISARSGILPSAAPPGRLRQGSGDWRSVVDDPDVEIVSLTTPNQFHPEMAIAILKTGKHLWCEKPMAPSFTRPKDGCGRQEVRQGGRARLQYIKWAIRTGALLDEKIIGVSICASRWMRILADPEARFSGSMGRVRLRRADDFAVHPLSLVAVLFGRVARVMCDMSNPMPTARSTSVAAARSDTTLPAC